MAPSANSTTQRGLFVAIEGISGSGKTTLAESLSRHFRDLGLGVVATKEPTESPIGLLARQSTFKYSGLALACLVAADRYEHLQRVIRPALTVGQLVVTDRYLVSSLVSQVADGVDREFVWDLHRYAPMPDLTFVLRCDPSVAHSRARERGVYSRFHADEIAATYLEHDLLARAIEEIGHRGARVFAIDVSSADPSEILGTAIEYLGESGLLPPSTIPSRGESPRHD